MSDPNKETMCAYCGGIDFEWMHRCGKHPGIEFCRGCYCPECIEDELDEALEDGYYEGDEERAP